MTDTKPTGGIALVIYGDDGRGLYEIETVPFGEDFESAEEQLREASAFLLDGYNSTGQMRFGPPSVDGVHINIAAIHRVEMRVDRPAGTGW